MAASPTSIPNPFAGADLPDARWRSLVEPWTDECPDPAHWIRTGGFQRARSLIESALREASNPILLRGPTGHGKTLLLRSLRSLAPQDYAPLLVPISNVEPEQIARWILQTADRSAVRDSAEELMSMLRAHRQSGWRTLMLLDEVQSSPPETIGKLFEILDAAGTDVMVILAALPGHELDDVLAAIPHPIRPIEISEPWTRADAELLLVHVALALGISANELIESIDVDEAIRAADGNPRLVRVALGQQLRSARPARAPHRATGVPARTMAPATIAPHARPAPTIDPPFPIEPRHAAPPTRAADRPALHRSTSIFPIAPARSAPSDPTPSREIPPASPSRSESAFDVRGILRRADVQTRARALFVLITDAQMKVDRGFQRAIERIDLPQRWRRLTARVLRARIGLAASGRDAVQTLIGILDRSSRRAKEAVIEALARSRAGAERSLIDVLDRSRVHATRKANEARTWLARPSRALARLRIVRTRVRESASVLGVRATSARDALSQSLHVFQADARSVLRRGNAALRALLRPAVALAIGAAALGAMMAIDQIPIGAIPWNRGASSATSIPPPVEPIAFRLNSDPWASVEVDGSKVGSTPITIRLSPGSHRFRAVMADGRVQEQALVVSALRDHHAFR